MRILVCVKRAPFIEQSLLAALGDAKYMVVAGINPATYAMTAL